MEINVSQLLKEPVGSTRELKIDEHINPAYEKASFYLIGTLKLIHIDRGILIKGLITNAGIANCNRCMTSFEYSTTSNFEEIFLPTIDINTGLQLHTKLDEFTIDNNNILTLDEALCQFAFLNIPMKLLCKDNCAGICPNCGQDLNKNMCKCEPNKYNKMQSKFAELKKEEINNGTIA
jgi:uncharacterized protein